ncbi:hypothetical protein TNCV_1504211 [Trichonephila clavipes]|uniref:Uncharacterized protein n=1 Tax=Trichonephila clavipes TaxID=2585209 RepID=A0A8X6RRA6_TRICX|nr:hypothetical protein TNCV_1504211 [Trichonephila clavipes]
MSANLRDSDRPLAGGPQHSVPFRPLSGSAPQFPASSNFTIIFLKLILDIREEYGSGGCRSDKIVLL